MALNHVTACRQAAEKGKSEVEAAKKRLAELEELHKQRQKDLTDAEAIKKEIFSELTEMESKEGGSEGAETPEKSEGVTSFAQAVAALRLDPDELAKRACLGNEEA
eukprot:3571098-Alexandrium_andersonii.AAC.1